MARDLPGAMPVVGTAVHRKRESGSWEAKRRSPFARVLEAPAGEDENCRAASVPFSDRPRSYPGVRMVSYRSAAFRLVFGLPGNCSPFVPTRAPGVMTPPSFAGNEKSLFRRASA